MTRDAVLQRFGARRAVGEMAHAGDLRGGQLQRVVLVVVPAAQVDRFAAPAALGHAEDSTKKRRLSSGFGVSSSTWARCARSNERMVGCKVSPQAEGDWRCANIARQHRREHRGRVPLQDLPQLGYQCAIGLGLACNRDEIGRKSHVAHRQARCHGPCPAGARRLLCARRGPGLPAPVPSRSSCRSAPADPPTSTPASSASTCRRRSSSRS